MASAQAARTRRMNLWRLEWLRLARTPRGLALGAVFLVFGLVEPVFTRYQSQLLGRVTGGVRITFPAPTPTAALSSYVSQVTGIGLIVVVVIAAGAFTFDAHAPADLLSGTGLPHFFPALAVTVLASAALLAAAVARLRTRGL